MLSRVLAWIGFASVVTFTVGCNSSEGPGQVPEDEFADRVALVFCESRAACCENGDHPFDTQQCVATVSAREGGPKSSATLKYDPSAAGECLEYLAASTQCGPFVADGPCAEVWRGTVPVGKRCNSGLDCARSVFDNVRCIENVCVSSPRAPRGSQGEPCWASCPSGEDCSRSAGGLNLLEGGTTAEAVCYADDGLYCTAAGCAEQVELGDPCSNDYACRGTAYCDRSRGECQRPAANGAACSSDRHCQSGHCAASGSFESRTCLPADEASAVECSFE